MLYGISAGVLYFVANPIMEMGFEFVYVGLVGDFRNFRDFKVIGGGFERRTI